MVLVMFGIDLQAPVRFYIKFFQNPDSINLDEGINQGLGWKKISKF